MLKGDKVKEVVSPYKENERRFLSLEGMPNFTVGGAHA
jgi:hypothetical protein